MLLSHSPFGYDIIQKLTFISCRNEKFKKSESEQEGSSAVLLQRDRATRYASKFVLCFTRYGSYLERFQTNSKSDLQGHSRVLAMVPFDRPHIRFFISVPLQLCHYFAPLTKYYYLLTKI